MWGKWMFGEYSGGHAERMGDGVWNGWSGCSDRVEARIPTERARDTSGLYEYQGHFLCVCINHVGSVFARFKANERQFFLFPYERCTSQKLPRRSSLRDSLGRSSRSSVSRLGRICANWFTMYVKGLLNQRERELGAVCLWRHQGCCSTTLGNFLHFFVITGKDLSLN